MTARRIIIAGGTRFIRRAVAPALADRGADIAILTRTPAVGRHVGWDGKTLDARRTREVDGADALIPPTPAPLVRVGCLLLRT